MTDSTQLFFGRTLRGDTPEVRRQRIAQHNQVWGPMGRNLPEDIWAVETQWSNMASGASAFSMIAREEDLRPMDDATLRAFYSEWQRILDRQPHDIDALTGQPPQQQALGKPVTTEDRETLRSLVHASARFLDDRTYQSFVDLFDESGSYRVEVDAPELPNTMVWMELDRDQLKERYGAVNKHEWRQFQQSRLVAVDTIELDSDSAQTSATVAIYHTDDEGRTSCYALARYEDCWHQSQAGWCLTERVVALRTRLLAMPSPLPL